MDPRYLYSCFSMFRKALRLLGNKGNVARLLYSCCSMCSTALKWLGNKGKVVRYLYSCMFSLALRLLGLILQSWISGNNAPLAHNM